MSQSICEAELLYSNLAVDPDLGTLVEMFVDEMPNRIATMLEQMSTSEWDKLRRTAHQIKGAAGSYGFDPITPHAMRLEYAIRDGEPEERIHEALDELIDVCRRARAGVSSG